VATSFSVFFFFFFNKITLHVKKPSWSSVSVLSSRTGNLGFFLLLLRYMGPKMSFPAMDALYLSACPAPCRHELLSDRSTVGWENLGRENLL